MTGWDRLAAPLILAAPLGLTTWVLLNAWFGSPLFTGVRRVLGRAPRLVSELAGCRFCLSYHVPLWPTVVWAAAGGRMDWYQVLVSAWAATGVAQVLDGLFPDVAGFDLADARPAGGDGPGDH